MKDDWKQIYKKSLMSKEWKEKRIEILDRDGNKCTRCGNINKLHIHHIKYEHDKPYAWEYENNTLVTLCEKCHKIEHGIVKSPGKELYDSLCPDFLYGEDFYLSDGVYICSDGTYKYD